MAVSIAMGKKTSDMSTHGKGCYIPIASVLHPAKVRFFFCHHVGAPMVLMPSQ